MKRPTRLRLLSHALHCFNAFARCRQIRRSQSTLAALNRAKLTEKAVRTIVRQWHGWSGVKEIMADDFMYRNVQKVNFKAWKLYAFDEAVTDERDVRRLLQQRRSKTQRERVQQKPPPPRPKPPFRHDGNALTPVRTYRKRGR